MINVKVGIAAFLLELGAWTGPLILGGSSDSALASYLLVHALACVLLSLFLFPLLSTRQARPRSAIIMLMLVCSYGVPVAGFVGVVVAAVVMRLYRKSATHGDFESLQMPEFDQHQRRQGQFRHTGLRSLLGNVDAPLQARLRAMAALQYVSGRTASPLLRSVLSDPSEDLRLLAYGMLDSMEKRINSNIDVELTALELAQQETGKVSIRTLAHTQRLSDLYWELIYQKLVQGDLRKHAVQESLRYCEWALSEESGNAQLWLRRGQLLHAQQRREEAGRAYEQARALGLPATRVLPYQAELCFDRKDFAEARSFMQELGKWNALPRLRPVVDYWSAR